MLTGAVLATYLRVKGSCVLCQRKQLPGHSRSPALNFNVKMVPGWCAFCKSTVRRPNRHRGVCPVLVRKEKLQAQPHFHLDVNAHADSDSRLAANLPLNDAVCFEDMLFMLKTFNNVNYATYDEYLNSCTYFQAKVEEYIQASLRRETVSGVGIPVKESHKKQYAAIIASMQRYGLIFERNNKLCAEKQPVYVEFGAGRGYLSHFLSNVFSGVDLVLLERKAYRFKAERSLRGRCIGFVRRVTVDLKDVVLSQIRELTTCSFVGFGKHLCGSATDLALRACFRTRQSESPTCKALGFAVSMCCYHRCSWDTYVNQSYLVKQGIGRSEFCHLIKVTSWATLGSSSSMSVSLYDRNEENVHSAAFKLQHQEKVLLGRLAKRILNNGRVEWCMGLGLKAKLITYIEEEISPENILLLVQR